MEKKNRDIFFGVCILLFGIVIGSVLAYYIVEINFPSKASNDGWLSFMGGFMGSCVSSIVAFYILYINRKDAEKSLKENQENTKRIQKENFDISMRAQNLNYQIARYQTCLNIANDVMVLIAELIMTMEDCHLNMTSNNRSCYRGKLNRASEICNLIEMKVFEFEGGEVFVKEIRIYRDMLEKRFGHQEDEDKKIMENLSNGLKKKTMRFYKSFVHIDDFSKENE